LRHRAGRSRDEDADVGWAAQAKNKDLPPEFWDLRRRMRNQKRTHRQQANKAKKR